MMVNLTEQIRRRVESKKAKLMNKAKAKLEARLKDPNMKKKLLKFAVASDNVNRE